MEVREISNKYGTLLHLGTTKRLDISQPHIEKLTHEVPIVEILETYEYDYFIDIGAGYGYFSLIAANNVKKEVYSIEPHPIRYGFLKWNLKDFNNVNVYNYIIGLGDSKYYMPSTPQGMVGGKVQKRNKLLNNVIVDLDEFYVPSDEATTIIKIDVEGNEEDVLKSGYLFRRVDDSIIWIVELHRKFLSKEKLFEYFPDFNREKLLERKQTEHWKFWRG